MTARQVPIIKSGLENNTNFHEEREARVLVGGVMISLGEVVRWSGERNKIGNRNDKNRILNCKWT